MNETWQYLFFNIIIIGVVFPVLLFIFKERIKSYIQYSIKYNYDIILEDYKSQEAKRQKAVLVAELVSEWISFPKDRRRLNQLSIEAFIWLPKETAAQLSKLLSHGDEAPDVKVVIAEVRNIILGKEEKIDPGIIIIFPPLRENDE